MQPPVRPTVLRSRGAVAVAGPGPGPVTLTRVLVLALLALLAVVVVPASPAAAHDWSASDVPGLYRATLDGDGRVGDVAVVAALPGVVPGFLLQADVDDGIAVRGAAGEPFLRVRDGRVWGNVHSPSWQRHTVLSSAVTDSTAPADPALAPRWVQAAASTTFAWLDERALGPSHAPPADPTRAQVVATWTLPVDADGTAVAIAGTTRWLPSPARVGDVDVADPPVWSVAAAASGLALGAGGLLRRRRARRGAAMTD